MQQELLEKDPEGVRLSRAALAAPERVPVETVWHETGRGAGNRGQLTDLQHRAEALVQGFDKFGVCTGDGGGGECCGPTAEASSRIHGRVNSSHCRQHTLLVDLVLLDLAEPDLSAGVLQRDELTRRECLGVGHLETEVPTIR